MFVPRASAFASVAVLEAVDLAFFCKKAGLRPDLEALRSRAGEAERSKGQLAWVESRTESKDARHSGAYLIENWCAALSMVSQMGKRQLPLDSSCEREQSERRRSITRKQLRMCDRQDAARRRRRRTTVYTSPDDTQRPCSITFQSCPCPGESRSSVDHVADPPALSSGPKADSFCGSARSLQLQLPLMPSSEKP